ncbi:hypothetical protein C4A75_09430 [Brevibacillus laterosporus]|uniref:YopX family protein n=1 Tax=Brevibacillus laterosporus TaxID=1465 RepID=UPI000CE44A29|nr:YopX family protein [Brevibacillus laterosporus]PPA84988.1 hypothetical protein C4A75_09430 [Brevibacillus laterosporus]
MREIKFRAFVVKERLDDLGSNMHLAGVSQYEVVVDVVDISFSNGAIDYVTDAEGYEYSFTNGNLKSVIQYTGLHDKTKWEDLTEQEQHEWLQKGKAQEDWKGKEIYEGDIVRISDHPFHGSWTVNGNYEVGYNEQMELCCGSWLLFREKHYAEVIGNIYENPELLKGEGN